jgi:hypothetical protein
MGRGAGGGGRNTGTRAGGGGRTGLSERNSTEDRARRATQDSAIKAEAQAEFERKGFSAYRLEDGSKALTNREINTVLKSVDKTGDKIARGMRSPESWQRSSESFIQAPKAQRESRGRSFDVSTRRSLAKQSLDKLAMHKQRMSVLSGSKRREFNKVIKDLASSKRPSSSALRSATAGMAFNDSVLISDGVEATWRLYK